MLQLESQCGHVFTEFARSHDVAECAQVLEQFGRDEVELTQVRKSRSSCEKPVRDMLTSMSIAFHAVTFDQRDALLDRLTKGVLRIRRHVEHCAFIMVG
jgi:hypothetical protein